MLFSRLVLLRRLCCASLLLLFGVVPAPPPRFTMANVLSAPYVYDLSASFDGKQLAFAAHEGGERNVYVWDGSSTVRVTSYTDDDGAALTQLAFVPHRRAVAFVRGGTEDEGARDNPNPSAFASPPPRHVVLVDTAARAPQAVGDGENIALSPRGDGIAWTNDRALMYAPLRAGAGGRTIVGASRTLSTSAGTLRDIAFSPDGTRIAFTNDRGDHSFVGTIRLGDARIVYATAAFTFDGFPAWSPDGTSVAFIRQSAAQARDPFLPDDVANAPWSIVVADVSTGSAHTVFRAPAGRGAAFYGLDGPCQLFWKPNGTSLIFPWERDGWRHLYSLATTGDAGQPQLLTPGTFEVETATGTSDGTALLLATNQNDIDRRHIWRMPIDGGVPAALTGGPRNQWSPVALSGRNIAYIDAGFDRPPFVVAGAPGSMAPVGGPDVPAQFPAASLVEPQLVTFRSGDGRELHGQLFVPRDGRAIHPALIFTHGGPMRQMLAGFHYFEAYTNLYESNQYFANAGFVVLSVNYRSGIMYGHDFREAPGIGYLGATEYADVLAGAAFLRARADVDAKRLGLYGLSYGGYLTALGLARNSDIFAAGVDYAGVTDWATLLDPNAKGFGTPEERATAQRASPLAAIDRWRSPVFVSQGDDDRNVTFVQGLDLVSRLRQRDVPVEELVFPNETHENQVHAHTVELYTAAAAFLERRLGTSP